MLRPRRRYEKSLDTNQCRGGPDVVTKPVLPDEPTLSRDDESCP